jgi:hypothetical protein
MNVTKTNPIVDFDAVTTDSAISIFTTDGETFYVDVFDLVAN